ncbi:MAG: putative damage-inducible protein DinB [Planctomycetota bacterium]|jgi:uncharacterized damage-inducible protein DinB
MNNATDTLQGFQTEFRRYRALAERTIDSLDEVALQNDPGGGNNSIAVLMQHIGGNLDSRFTAFLAEDGEKPTRHRDGEFEAGRLTQAALRRCWDRGWQTLQETLEGLSEEDLVLPVHIRAVRFSVAEALARSLAHIAYHVGQIVLLARLQQGEAWQALSIPKGESESYAKDPYLERGLLE